MEEIKDSEGRGSSSSSPSSPANFLRRSKAEDLKMTSASNSPRGQVASGSIRHKITASVDSFDSSSRHKITASVDSLEGLKDLHKGLIDTAAPFESVKEAVSKFAGLLDRKASKIVPTEKNNYTQIELEKLSEELPKYRREAEAAEDAKTQVLDELRRTKRLLEELRHTLERSETEEAQAKQDSELAQLRAREIEEGISDDASAAAKAQVYVSKARHETAVKELTFVERELALLQGDYTRLVEERDSAVARSNDAITAAKNMEIKVEELTLELMTIKQALESAHASHLEAEEDRTAVTMARDQDALNWEKELKQSECEMQHLKDQLSSENDLKSKLDTMSTVLLNLKAELATYKEGSQTLNRLQVASTKEELKEVQSKIAKTRDEINFLSVAASSLKSELERETDELATLKQREGLATVLSLEAELSRMQSELELVLTREREATEKLDGLPKLVEQATRDADQAKSVAQFASEELRKAKEEMVQAKAAESSVEVRVLDLMKDIEATKASENLALGTIKAMKESEEKKAAMITTTDGKPVTLSVEEYYKLSKNVREAEDLAGERVVSAIERIKGVKKSELMNLERLEAARKELEEKKTALKVAMEKADKANEEKMGVEKELREWRGENEQRRTGSDATTEYFSDSPSNSSSGYFEESGKENDVGSKLEIVSYNNEVVPELKPRRKKSFFPRVLMFLARKKVQSLK